MKSSGDGGKVVRVDGMKWEIEKGFGLQSISNREPLQVLEHGVDKRQPGFRNGNPRSREKSGLKWHGIWGRQTGRGHDSSNRQTM